MKEIIEKIMGWQGAMLSHSKSMYQDKHPNNLVIFNSNVCTESEKIWYGDLDISKSIDSLSKLAIELNKPIYVLREMDGRFDNEDNPKLDRFVIKIEKNGDYILGTRESRYTYLNLNPKN